MARLFPGGRREIGFVLGWFCLFLRARGQIRVLGPPVLAQQYSETHGRIEGSTATFGAPFYGDKVLGRLVYGESSGDLHCTKNDYNVPDPDKMAAGTSGHQYDQVKLINIILVRRGKCSFTTKVKVAEEKGAHAVVIVDKDDSGYKASDMHKIIVADDGFGGNIHIPSVLIAYDDGAKLIDMAKTKTPVIVELSWDIPTNHVVVMDLWMSSASKESQKFLKDFAPKRRALNEVIKFQPHYAVFAMPSSDPGVYAGLCLNDNSELCAEDPDAGGDILGKDVLDEDTRQLCIHEQYKKKSRPSEFSATAEQTPEFAAEYWDYVEKFPEVCPLEGTSPEAKFGRVCSEKVMAQVGINVADIQHCVLTTQKQKLEKERDFPAWSPRALRVNGWRYSGMLDADLVTRALCSGFVKQPTECQDLLRPRDPTVPYTGTPSGGVTLGTFIGVLSLLVGLAFVASLLYKRSLKQSVRTVLREEVMLEVQAQMGEYRQLGGH